MGAPMRCSVVSPHSIPCERTRQVPRARGVHPPRPPLLGGGKFRQRPHGHRAHQGRGIGEQRGDRRLQSRVAGIAGRDKCVADEPVASGASDGACPRSVCGNPDHRDTEARRARAPRDRRGPGASLPAPRAANLFHGHTARQSSQPKMRLPIGRLNSRAMCPRCSMVR